MLNQTVLVESQSAREDTLGSLDNSQAISKLRNVCEDINFYEINLEHYMTSKQVSEFYQIQNSTLRELLSAHREELISDGVKTIRGEELKSVRQAMGFSNKVRNVTLYTPRAVLRVGMLLQDSHVAHSIQKHNSEIYLEKKRLEIKFGDYLEAVIGWKFNIQRQFPVKTDSGTKYIDFYVEELDLAIEYDEYDHKFNKKRDKEREDEIKDIIPDLEFVRVEQGKEHKGVTKISKKAFK